MFSIVKMCAPLILLLRFEYQNGIHKEILFCIEMYVKR